jgi:dihydrofolate synthase/folylpolyglutamate synthase
MQRNSVWQYILNAIKSEQELFDFSRNPNIDYTTKNEMKLANIKSSLFSLDNPQNNLRKIIHIAGTNGKGSVSKFIESGLFSMGFDVTCFTSPHLIKLNERITHNQQQISNEEIFEIIQELQIKLKNTNLSFFEAITLISIIFNKKKQPEYSIYEVGLGGKFDATNVFLNKKIAIITNIGYDHKEILGKTIEEIASDKCHIIKGTEFAICSKQDYDEVYKIFNQYCDKYEIKKENRFIIDSIKVKEYEDSYQQRNLATSLKALEILMEKKLNEEDVNKAIKNFKHHGRLENIPTNKIFPNLETNNIDCLVDGAHNEDGIRHLCDYISKKNYDFKIGVFAMLKRKDFSEKIAENMKKFDLIFTISSQDNSEIWHNSEYLSQKIKNYVEFKDFSNLSELHKYICNFSLKNQNKRILVTYFGSLYFIGSLPFMKNIF